MSIELMNLVWNQKLPLGPKMVLMCLADYANADGECFPGNDTIAKRSSISKASLYRHLSDLEEQGYLSRHELPNQRTLYVLDIGKFRQLALLDPPGGPSQFATGRKMRQVAKAPLPPLKVRVQRSQIETPIKQPPVNHQEPPPCEGSQGHGDQWKTLDKRQQQLVSSYQPIPSSLRLDLFCTYVDHCAVMRKQLSGPAWMLIRAELQKMERAGHDLNESLKLTIRRQLCDPVIPEKTKNQSPRANDDLSGTVYGANDYSKLPAHLRPAADVHEH